MSLRPDSLYIFRCVTCDQQFDKIPEGAKEISRSYNSRITLWKFPDCTQHSLRKKKQTATAVKDK